MSPTCYPTTTPPLRTGSPTRGHASPARPVLHGGRRHPAKGHHLGLTANRRANADTCESYLLRKRAHLDYPTRSDKAGSIATGVIEGACRHLVKDRMDITGARWGLEGAEAILRLHALRTNGDLDDYWHLRLAQEQQRVHQSRYAADTIPRRRDAPSGE